MKNIKVKELEVPTGAMPEVVDILIDNDLDNSPTGKDELVFILNTSKALDKNKRGQTAGNSNLPSFVVPTRIELLPVPNGTFGRVYLKFRKLLLYLLPFRLARNICSKGMYKRELQTK